MSLFIGVMLESRDANMRVLIELKGEASDELVA